MFGRESTFMPSILLNNILAKKRMTREVNLAVFSGYTPAKDLMRFFLFLLFVFLLAPPMSAAELPVTADCLLPTPFVSVLYAKHDGSFYDQQAADWKVVATGDCSTDEAWWQYYKTANYSNRFGSGDYDLDAILAAAAQELDPEGFELNYLYFAHDQNPVTRWPHLLKAHAADPNQMEAATGLAAYYTVRGELDKREAILKRMHEAKAIPNGVMEYNHNQLMSVATNGILITHGDADTYPSWLLQYAYGIRRDVTVINMSLLLGFESYQDQVQRELGLESLFAEGKSGPPAVFAKLTEQDRPVFLAATGRHYMPELSADRLFISGLTFQYSLTPVNNLRMIAKGYEDTWRLESLRQPLTNDPGQAVADQLNQNYLPALLELHEYYVANPAPAFRENLQLIQTIAARADMEDEVNTFLRGPAPDPQLASSAPGIRAKDIFKQVVYIPAGIYRHQGTQKEVSLNGFFMQETEVTNAAYQLFLEDLLRQRRFDLIDSVAIERIDFEELFPNGDMDAMKGQLNAGHPAYDDYPLVNVSHRAAQLYALWLTQVYNQDPKRKDGRKVRFRLPTEMEFAYAFSGGKQYAPYPWGGPYFRNSKGCYLSNFNTVAEVREKDVFPSAFADRLSEEERAAALAKAKDGVENCDIEVDGGWLTVPARAYFPNDFGLYNMAGNAAEMLAAPGKTMGGSWYDPAYNMQAEVVTERLAPHPSTGFRLIMTYE